MNGSIVGWCVGVLCVAVAATEAQGFDPEALAAANMAAVVVVEGVRDGDGTKVQGSGCVVDTRGYVLMSAHQASGVSRFTARFADSEAVPLELVEAEDNRELALLKADRPLPNAVALGDAGTLRSGAPLLSIAAPLSLDFTTVTGTVAHPRRTVRGFPVMQVSLTATHGSSGGPVFDRHGRLVGLITGELADTDFTIVTHINNAWPMLRRHGLDVPDTGLPPEDSLGLSPAPDISETALRAVEAYNRGVAAADPADKQAAYALATTLLPGFFRAWFNLGVARTLLEDHEGAVAAYEKAADLDPESVGVWRNLGRLHLRQEAHEAAVAAFEKAAALAPALPQSYNDLGEAWRQAENAAKAEAAFKQALEHDPDYVPAHYNLGLLYSRQDRNEDALRHFEQYLALHPRGNDREQVEAWMELLRQP